MTQRKGGGTAVTMDSEERPSGSTEERPATRRRTRTRSGTGSGAGAGSGSGSGSGSRTRTGAGTGTGAKGEAAAKPKRPARKAPAKRVTSPASTTAAAAARETPPKAAPDAPPESPPEAPPAETATVETATAETVADMASASVVHKQHDEQSTTPHKATKTIEATEATDLDASTTPTTPAAAFDALYARHAEALTRQAYLLTGRQRQAQRAVQWAFQLAWQRWPEVAVDRDPAGWVRAAAYEYALAPWHRRAPRRHITERPTPVAPAPPPAAPADRALLDALLALPATYRRALLLHDGVGLGLCETAAEVEASTPATAGRLTHAREAVAARLPELGLRSQPPVRQGEILHERLTRLALAHPVAPPAARTVRAGSRRHTRRLTQGALGLTALIAAATAFTLANTPDAYDPPEQKPAVGTSATPGAQAEPGVRRRTPPPAARSGRTAPRAVRDDQLAPRFG